MAKTKKPRQRHLPQLEPPSHKDIDNAADDYVEVRNQRMSLAEAEVTKRDTVQRLMEKHGLTEYLYDGKKVSLVPSEVKVKVKSVATADVEDEDDEK